MVCTSLQSAELLLSELADRQHGVVARRQLLELGFSRRAIAHRIERRRLHPVWRGVYALGRARITPRGRWMAAVLASGQMSVLSHASAAALWDIRPVGRDEIEVSVPTRTARRLPGIIVHRRRLAAAEVTREDGIRVTSPICTLVDIANQLEPGQLEAAINEADKLGLTDPDELRSALDGMSRRPGMALLRQTVDRHTFTLTDSELERRFLPLARRAGLPLPITGHYLNGFRTDFYWLHLGLVVETDGLRYHRTPA